MPMFGGITVVSVCTTSWSVTASIVQYFDPRNERYVFAQLVV